MELQSGEIITGKFVKELRHHTLKTQHEFWGQLGLTQSGGWRYENDTPIPQPMQKLIILRHALGDEFEAAIERGVKELRAIAGTIKPTTYARVSKKRVSRG